MNPKEQPAHDEQNMPGRELVDSGHFYAAYVFDQPDTRQNDVEKVLSIAAELNYPVRYWWLSDAMDLRGAPDRLIVCVHHPSSGENAGMDLYEKLVAEQATWDDLEAAVFDEYLQYGNQAAKLEDIRGPMGDQLFPEERAGQ